MPADSVKVRINIQGLCPIIPSAEFVAGTMQPWIGSFLVNADATTKAKFDDLDRPLHLPYLEFSVEDLDGFTGSADFRLKVRHRLSFQDLIFIPPVGTSDGVDISFADSIGKFPKNEEEEKLLNWVPRISEVETLLGEVDSSCFTSAPKFGQIVARVHITHGRLSTGFVGKVNQQPVVVKLPGTGKHQAMAGSLLIEISVPPGVFEIRMQDFKKKKPPVKIPFKAALGRTLEISVANLCIENLFESVGNGNLDPDKDFRWHYVLSSLADKVKYPSLNIPSPVAIGDTPLEEAIDGLSRGGGGTDTARCSPPRFNKATSEQVATMRKLVTDLRSS